ncbi:MAG: hypothetical protein ACRD6W_01140, partial [Nitrososphaerales archaeon]
MRECTSSPGVNDSIGAGISEMDNWARIPNILAISSSARAASARCTCGPSRSDSGEPDVVFG